MTTRTRIATVSIAVALLVIALGFSASGNVGVLWGSPNVDEHVNIVSPETVEWSPELALNGFQNSVREILPNSTTNLEMQQIFNDTCLFLDSGYSEDTVKGYWSRQGFNKRQAAAIAMASENFCVHWGPIPGSNV